MAVNRLRAVVATSLAPAINLPRPGVFAPAEGGTALLGSERPNADGLLRLRQY
jgi:hypothetical protein